MKTWLRICILLCVLKNDGLAAAQMHNVQAQDGQPRLDPSVSAEAYRVMQNPDAEAIKPDIYKVAVLLSSKNLDERSIAISFILSHQSDDTRVIDALVGFLDSEPNGMPDWQPALRALERQSNVGYLLQTASHRDEGTHLGWPSRIFRVEVSRIREPLPEEKSLQATADRFTRALLAVIDDKRAQMWAAHYALNTLYLDAPDSYLALDKFFSPPQNDSSLSRLADRAIDLCIASPRSDVQSAIFNHLLAGTPQVQEVLIDHIKSNQQHAGSLVMAMLRQPSLRARGLKLLLDCGDALAAVMQPTVAVLDTDADPAIRRLVLDIAAKNRFSDGYPDLVASAVSDGDQWIRLKAIEIASTLGYNAKVARALGAAATSNDPITRDAALPLVTKLVLNGDPNPFRQCALQLKPVLLSQVYSANPAERAKAQRAWSGLGLGPLPTPPALARLYLGLEVFGAIDLLLFGLVVSGFRRVGGDGPEMIPIHDQILSRFKSAFRATSAAGVLLFASGIIFEIGNLTQLGMSQRTAGIEDLAELLVSLMIGFAGLAIYAWGLAIARHQMRHLDVTVFYIVSGLATLLEIGTITFTVIGTVPSTRPSLSTATLMSEAMCLCLTIWAMVAVTHLRSGLIRINTGPALQKSSRIGTGK